MYTMYYISLFLGVPIPLNSVSDFYGTGDSSAIITDVSCSEDGEINMFNCQYEIVNMDAGSSCNDVAVLCQGNYNCLLI